MVISSTSTSSLPWPAAAEIGSRRNRPGASLQEGPTYTEGAYAEGPTYTEFSTYGYTFSASKGYLITYATIGAQATSMATNTGTAQGKGVEA